MVINLELPWIPAVLEQRIGLAVALKELGEAGRSRAAAIGS